MRPIILGLLLISTLSLAAPTPERFNQAAFEKRFQNADKNRDGKLSRDEAYAEFPRMPEYFDEIDRNKDQFISLKEVNQALERRINAAMGSGQGGKSYASTPGAATPAATEATAPSFSSKAEARRQQRYDYYESLAGSQEASRHQGQPTQPEPYPTLLQKSY